MHNGDYITCSECTNTQCFVKLCSPEWIEKINKVKGQMLYKKGQYIVREGEPINGVYLVQNGKVKIVSSKFGGKEIIVRLASDAHLIGHSRSGSETYSMSALAMGDSILCFIENQLLYEACMSNTKFTFNIMMFYVKELRKSELRAKYFGQMSVREKVIFSLYYALETFDCAYDGGSLDIELSRTEIAEIAGTNPDQVSRTLVFLKKNKIISVQGKHILIKDINVMKKFIDPYSESFT